MRSQVISYYCVVGRNNDSRCTDKIVKRSLVKELKFHHFPKDESKRRLCKEHVDKGLNGFIVSDNKVVCSNHFEYGKPTCSSPVPTMHVYEYWESFRAISQKSRTIVYEKLTFDNNQNKDCPFSVALETTKNVEVQCSMRNAPVVIIADLTRTCDVIFFLV